MKMICPTCKKPGPEFTPTEMELQFFDERELEIGEAMRGKPCQECRFLEAQRQMQAR
jgi:hypothetical protein